MSQPLARAHPAKPRRKEWLLYSWTDARPAAANRVRSMGIKLLTPKGASPTCPQRSNSAKRGSGSEFGQGCPFAQGGDRAQARQSRTFELSPLVVLVSLAALQQVMPSPGEIWMFSSFSRTSSSYRKPRQNPAVPASDHGYGVANLHGHRDLALRQWPAATSCPPVEADPVSRGAPVFPWPGVPHECL